MKKSEIAAAVFAKVEAMPLEELVGGATAIPVADLAGLLLVPWFCDVSVQWALRLTVPGSAAKKTLLKRVKGTVAETDQHGSLLIGIPGDGIEPSTYVFGPLVEAISEIAQAGMTLELAAANLGVVKRDTDAKAETGTAFGNQRYLGSFDGQGHWVASHASPGISVSALHAALDCGRMVVRDGPWIATDQAEAYAVLMHWLASPEANVNPMAVKRFISWQDGAFVNSDPGMIRKLCGLGLGFFRHRFASGPFRWPEPGPVMYPHAQLEEVARGVVGC